MKRDREKLYYSISEVSEAAEVKAHVLRYWETQFRMLRPKKSRAGNRMYRPRDLNLVLTIRDLLYRNGYTIAGARRKLIEAKRGGHLEAGVLQDEPGVVMVDEDGEDGISQDPNQLTIGHSVRDRGLREIREDIRELLGILEEPASGSPTGNGAPGTV